MTACSKSDGPQRVYFSRPRRAQVGHEQTFDGGAEIADNCTIPWPAENNRFDVSRMRGAFGVLNIAIVRSEPSESALCRRLDQSSD